MLSECGWHIPFVLLTVNLYLIIISNLVLHIAWGCLMAI